MDKLTNLDRKQVLIVQLCAIGIIALIAIGVALVYGSFSLEKFPLTKGYDPEFLKQTDVKLTCQQSHQDLQRVGLEDLGFCDKNLGTL